MPWNEGGNDRAEVGYASLFGDASWTFGTKATRTTPGVFTDAVTLEVVPEDVAGSDLPVVILTSAKTVSAGEVMTLALSELPRVRIVGEPTAGGFSDTLEREQPSGAAFRLSHPVYRDSAGSPLENSA